MDARSFVAIASLLLGFWWAIRSARREDKPSFFVSIAFLVFVIFNGIPAP
jgi:hypothetical protein